MSIIQSERDVDGSCFARDAPLCDLWTPAVPRCYFRHCSRFLVSVVLFIRTNTRLELARLWISVSQEGITKQVLFAIFSNGQ